MMDFALTEEQRIVVDTLGAFACEVMRDVMGQIIADGTPQIQKLIVARHLFGRQNV